jgi:hypothetical protein
MGILVPLAGRMKAGKILLTIGMKELQERK